MLHLRPVLLSLSCLSLFASISALDVRQAFAQGATVAQSGGSVSADCAGNDATVDGSGNTVRLRNACRTLTVNGSGNTIQVELQSAGTINLNGSGNRVSYSPVGGTADAAVVEHGQGNTVERVAAASGGTATVTGSITAQGGLSIHGPNGESIQIGPNGIVAVPSPGTGSAVTVTPGAVVAVPGVVATPQATALSPGQVMLSGNGQNKDMPCSGANVYINGDNGHFTLRGGCKALYIRGSSDIVHVELEPGAQIAIQGGNSLVYFLLTQSGPQPALVVNGANSRAFRVQRIDDTNGTELPAGVSTGALPGIPGIALGAAAGGTQVAFQTAQAALAFARGQSIVALRRDLGAVSTQQGTKVSLSGDVLFDFNRDELRPDALRSLAELSVLIARTQPHGVQIVGYTDSIGTPQYNLTLSERRARHVEQWLLDDGQARIAAFDVAGRGAADPIAANTLPDGRDNPEGRQQNRRVEILLQQ